MKAATPKFARSQVVRTTQVVTLPDGAGVLPVFTRAVVMHQKGPNVKVTIHDPNFSGHPQIMIPSSVLMEAKRGRQTVKAIAVAPAPSAVVKTPARSKRSSNNASSSPKAATKTRTRSVASEGRQVFKVPTGASIWIVTRGGKKVEFQPVSDTPEAPVATAPAQPQQLAVAAG
jgi:hypothetical protein